VTGKRRRIQVLDDSRVRLRMIKGLVSAMPVPAGVVPALSGSTRFSQEDHEPFPPSFSAGWSQEPGVMAERVLRDRYIQSVADGLSPAAAAGKLGLPGWKARLWVRGFVRLARDLRLVKGKTPGELASRPALTGITLVHSADTVTAVPGQVVTFTAWVLNDTESPLHSIRLVTRSLTNAGMEPLNYATSPGPEERRLAGLLPGAAAAWTFTYQVTERDLSHGGELISAIGVEATASSGEVLWDEGDAVVPVVAGEVRL
jgi:hypothetical protein